MITETSLLRDLEASHTRAAEAWAALLSLGVSVDAFMVSGSPGVDRVATTGRLWHPSPLGQDAIVLPCWRGPGPLYNDNLVLADLLAIAMDQPDRWYYRDGAPGLVLGEDHLVDALDSRQPIHLHPDPLAWLQAGCDGAVILEDAERRHAWARMADDGRAAA